MMDAPCSLYVSCSGDACLIRPYEGVRWYFQLCSMLFLSAEGDYLILGEIKCCDVRSSRNQANMEFDLPAVLGTPVLQTPVTI